MADRELRLQVYLARAGVGSRRACETFIEAGRVTLNGEVVVRQGAKVGPGDLVELDGRQVRPEAASVYLALHKPAGCLCSSRDERGRPLVIDLVAGAAAGRLFTVGRLDFMSSGLILLTNDGPFCRAVSHPSRCIEKEYLVETLDPIPAELLESFTRGLVIEGVAYRAERYVRLSEATIRLILLEGKNREIRRVLDSRGLRVRRIHRLRIGPVRLGELPPGGYRPLEEREVQLLLG